MLVRSIVRVMEVWLGFRVETGEIYIIVSVFFLGR